MLVRNHTLTKWENSLFLQAEMFSVLFGCLRPEHHTAFHETLGRLVCRPPPILRATPNFSINLLSRRNRLYKHSFTWHVRNTNIWCMADKPHHSAMGISLTFGTQTFTQITTFSRLSRIVDLLKNILYASHFQYTFHSVREQRA